MPLALCLGSFNDHECQSFKKNHGPYRNIPHDSTFVEHISILCSPIAQKQYAKQVFTVLGDCHLFLFIPPMNKTIHQKWKKKKILQE